MTSAQYWKIRALMLQRELVEQQAREQVAAAMQAAGLDPAKAYRADDATETLIEMDADDHE